MATPDRYPIRLVVQLVQEGNPPHSGYRVVAYPAPSGVTLRPATFSSREQLLQRLQSALPDFDPELLAGSHEARVLFARDMELTNAQLSLLGLVQ